MSEAEEFDYNRPSRDTLAGIVVVVDDDARVKDRAAFVGRASRPSPTPSIPPPHLEDLSGITVSRKVTSADFR